MTDDPDTMRGMLAQLLRTDIAKREAALAAALADVARLRELATYARHLPWCYEVPCSCGYDGALAATEPKP
jgi:hypothetical protein